MSSESTEGEGEGSRQSASLALPPFSRAAWVETTSATHEHGGEDGWRLGEALWSPSKTKTGQDRYALMRELQAGDIVLHLADDESGGPKGVLGWSAVAAACETLPKGPEEPGEWAGQEPFYRVRLRDYHRFPFVVPIEPLFTRARDVIAANAAKEGSPFARYGDSYRTAMGKYVTRCSPEVYRVMDELVRKTHRVWGIYIGSSMRRNFALALDKATWGADDEKKVADIQEGDRLVFVCEVSSDQNPPPAGFPRVKSPEEFSGVAAEVVYGVVTGAPYTTQMPLWPNGLYPARFAFREVGRNRGVQFSLKTFPRALVDAVRNSAIKGTRPVSALLHDFGPWTNESEAVIAKQDPAAMVAEFSAALRDAHVTFGDDHDEVVRLFLASLMAKPFVILTGLSGSGKTQIALKLGEWFGRERFRLIPVRPDWTGPEFLLGYEDSLRKVSHDGRRAWTVPPALEFMLTAAADPKNPYLLILDEMNLAHVERYFADVLSGMESRADVLPNLERAGGSWHQRADRGHLPVPRNLFIVGTVNVDETTYLFSPKVLDRANTLEFRVATAALPTNPSSSRRPTACSEGNPSLLAGMLSIATNDSWQGQNSAGTAGQVVEVLRSLHQGLSEHGCEFGHRTFYEGVRLAALLHAAGAASVEEQVDVFVLQKVLPRIHGARRTLEPVLRTLGGFAFEMRMANGKNSPFDETLTGAAKLPRSFQKLQRMMKALRTNQFASFSD